MADDHTAGGRDVAARPRDDLDGVTIEALGSLSKALETTERARGHLYSWHQLTGTADFELDRAVELLRSAGQHDLADRVERELLGRNVLEGRWTFQVVEEYDDTYYAGFRELEREARDRLAGGRRHLHEARMKQDRRSPGRSGHELLPPAGRVPEAYADQISP